MGFKGDLSTFNLANIFQTLSMNRQTGTLAIIDKEEGIEAFVFFKDGIIRQVATSDTRKLRIGEVLLRTGLLDSESLEQALATQRTTRERLGDVLIRMGLVSREQIVSALQFQQEEMLYELFSLEKALFEFNDNERPESIFSSEIFDLNIVFNTNSVMMEAMRRLDEWNRIRNYLPNENEIPVQAVSPKPGQLEPNHEAVYALVNGVNSARKICALSYLGKFSTFQILAELLRDGFLRLKEISELVKTGQECLANGFYEDCITVLGLVLGQNYWEPGVVRNLADAYIAVGDTEKAIEKLREIVSYYRTQNMWDDAIKNQMDVVKLSDDTYSERVELGDIAAEAGKKGRAVEEYRNALRRVDRRENSDDFITISGRFLELAPNDIKAREELVEVLIQTNRRKDALEHLSKLAVLFAGQGDYKSAIAVYHRLVTLAPENSEYRKSLEQYVDLEGRRRARRLQVVRLCILLVLLLSVGGIILGYSLHSRNAFKEVVASADKLAEKGEFRAASSLVLDFMSKYPFANLFNPVDDKIVEYTEMESRKRNTEQQLIKERREAAIKRASDFLASIPTDEKLVRVEEYLRRLDELEKQGEHEQEFEKLREARLVLESVRNKIEGLAAEAERLIAETDYDAAHGLVKRIIEAFPLSERAASLKLPLKIECTLPSTARVFINGKLEGPSPVVVFLPVNEVVKVRIEAEGFAPREETVDSKASSRLMVALERQAYWTRELDRKTVVNTRAVHWREKIILVTRYGELIFCDKFDGKATSTVTLSEMTGAKSILHDVTANPVLYMDNLLIPSLDGFLYSVDLKGPSITWKYEAKDFLQGEPGVFRNRLTDGDVVVFGADNGMVFCVDAVTGTELWKFKTGASVASRPIADDEAVYVTSKDTYVYKLRLENGTQIVRRATSAPILAGAEFIDGRICLGNQAGHFYIMNKSDLEIEAFRSVDNSPIVSRPLIVGGHVIVAASPQPGSDRPSVLAVIEPRNWSVASSAMVRGLVEAQPVEFHGAIYLCTSLGTIQSFKLDLQDGANLILHWSYEVGSRVLSDPVVVGDMIVIASERGLITAFK